MPKKEPFPWDDLWDELTLDELIELIALRSSADDGDATGSDEDSDSGELCRVRGEGDPGWYWGDEVLDEDER